MITPLLLKRAAAELLRSLDYHPGSTDDSPPTLNEGALTPADTVEMRKIHEETGTHLRFEEWVYANYPRWRSVRSVVTMPDDAYSELVEVFSQFKESTNNRDLDRLKVIFEEVCDSEDDPEFDQWLARLNEFFFPYLDTLGMSEVTQRLMQQQRDDYLLQNPFYHDKKES